MWIFFAFGSALFAGLTAILAKCGIRKTDSTVATAIRTIVVLAFSWLMVFITGSQGTISSISGRTLLFLALSGLATGGYASLRRAYCEETYCPERDCRYIPAACAAVLGVVIGAVTMRCGRKWLR